MDILSPLIASLAPSRVGYSSTGPDDGLMPHDPSPEICIAPQIFPAVRSDLALRTPQAGPDCEGQEQNCECEDEADIQPNGDDGESDETTNQDHFAPPLAAKAISHGANVMSRS
jgi:hypothetical protein